DITARRENEEAIRQSEERFRVALKNSPVVVFNQDLDLRYTWVYNPTYGFPRQSVVGKLDSDLMPAADAARWSEIKRGVLETGVGTREEVSTTVDGQRRTFDLTVEPLNAADGRIVGVTCASIDISERKREQALTTRLAAIVESSEDAIIGKTLDGIILSWNPGAERLFGYLPDEIIGQSAIVLNPPDRIDEFREVTERLKHGEPMEQHDTVRVRQDGRPIDVSVSVSVVRDAMGRIIGAATIARDITQRKRMEELQRFRAEVSDSLGSSLEYPALLANITRLAVPRIADWCAVYLLDEEGTIQQLALSHVDPAQTERAKEMLRRYPPDPEASTGVAAVIRTGRPEFVERVTDDQLAAEARDVEHLKRLVDVGFKSYLIVPMTARNRTFGAISFVSADSARRLTPDVLALAEDLAYRAALAVDNARLFQEIQKANEDLEQRVVQRTIELQAANAKLKDEVTERKRATDQLRQLSAHLQSAREEERIRISRELHDELGQVLTAIKIDLSLLADRLDDRGYKVQREALGDEIRSTVKMIDETIQKMRLIIRELRPEILDHLGLSAAIEWQVQELQARTGIEYHFDTGVDDSHLDRDRTTAVFRILQEALTNVARHAQATRVDIALNEESGQLVLMVRDNGRGLPENGSSGQKSFGLLGMRERALAFGGDVNVSSPGGGTVVVARIPT
ncbi:MAG: PAS domain S-box protein, partial [Chloroflexi bacterium]|nr:PAS domain S-box protein [Chloroflexota bacterium]